MIFPSVRVIKGKTINMELDGAGAAAPKVTDSPLPVAPEGNGVTQTTLGHHTVITVLSIGVSL